jgi:hypothetical protein
MCSIAEETRARWMASDWRTTGSDVVRIDSAARRAVRDLNLPTGGPAPQSLDDLFAEIAAEKAADSETDS